MRIHDEMNENAIILSIFYKKDETKREQLLVHFE